MRQYQPDTISTGLLHQQATAGAPAGDINAPAAQAEPFVEWPEQGQDLPEQMGGVRTTLPPGVDTFKLPDTLAPLWHDITAEDKRPFLPNGQPNPTKGIKYARRQLKFDRNAPLVVVGGKHDGEPMTATFSSHPRPRGKTDDPKTAWISDASYLLDVALGDKSRPADPKVLEATINKYGGRTIRLEHGLTGQCRPDRVRFIRVTVVGADGQPAAQDMQDPSGKKGCARRYYTSAFKNEQGGYDLEVACACGDPSPEEAAQGVQPVDVLVRGFESVERILMPLGS